jgi:hypothetical protein
MMMLVATIAGTMSRQKADDTFPAHHDKGNQKKTVPKA